MKILLDECLPSDFRHSFPDHDVQTLQFAGFKGKKNGALLSAAEIAGFDVLMSVDVGLAYQQPRMGRKISIVVVRSRSNQFENLLPLVRVISQALSTISVGQTLVLPVPS